MLSVLTLNLHSQRDRWLGRRELLLSGILDELPDFIAFQDVSVVGRQVNWLARQINARWGNHLYYWVQIGRHRFRPTATGGTAILSRLPIIRHEKIDLGHQQVALLANIELPLGRTLDFVSAQLSAEPHMRQVRHEQIMALSSALAANGRSPYQIIGCDLAAPPSSRVVHRIKENYISAFEHIHDTDPIATYPTALITHNITETTCVDYIFASTVINIHDVRFFGRQPHPADPNLFPSDHIGIIANITFPDVTI